MTKLKISLPSVVGIALLFTATACIAEDREYSVTVKVLETKAISYRPDGTRTTTTCTSSGPESLNCDSTTVSAAQHTDLVSFADLSDGKLYMLSCVLGTGRRFLSGFGQGMAASAGAATVSGCAVSPGLYRARWDKGRLKILHDRNGKPVEVTFVILNSAPMPAQAPPPEATGSAPEKTLLLLSSTPTGADIEIDGIFAGQTPSSIPTLTGEHSIRIHKDGYEPWERKIKTVGGEVTVAADLKEKPK
jgi:hypothetical protein